MGQGDNVKAGEKSSSGGPQALPIRQYAKDIVEAVKSNSTVVVIGETGSGKTTQLSQVCQSRVQTLSRDHRRALSLASHIVLQILYEAGFAENGLIAVTQPRRVVSKCRSSQHQLLPPP
jgi:ATP-dependent RNA helicase DHX8/PRP22